ncbi:MAG: hypothetical protein NHB14_05870 [Desulfosporosinus sp.]|nr:hypothetical protein [Desulfosporosinus sp.]
MGYSYFNGERTVAGTAALLHKINLDGGLEEHYKKVLDEVITCVIEKGNEELKANNLRLVR